MRDLLRRLASPRLGPVLSARRKGVGLLELYKVFRLGVVNDARLMVVPAWDRSGAIRAVGHKQPPFVDCNDGRGGDIWLEIHWVSTG